MTIKWGRIYKKGVLLVALFACVVSVGQQTPNSPIVESFEDGGILQTYDRSSASTLASSQVHYKFGKKSLEWKWNATESSFGTSNFKIKGRDAKDMVYEGFFPSSPTLVLSIYNEVPQNGSIKISYQKEGKDEVWFPIPLQFQGWRTIRVPFYEMYGNPPQRTAAIAYNYFKVSATTPKGQLFFDDIVFSQYMDERYPYPDLMVPFIKKDWDEGIDHWMPLMKNLELLEKMKTPPINQEEIKSLATIQKRLDENIKPKNGTGQFKSAKEVFRSLGIYEDGKNILGPPLEFNHREVFYDSLQQGLKRFNNIGAFGKALKKMAEAYFLAKSTSEKKELEQMFLMASRYFLDQGWQKGASGGARHHIGYAIRELSEAMYMMRNPLENAGLLSEIGLSLQWLNNLGMVLGDENNFHVNIDYLNTQSYYHLMLICLSKNKERQVALLKAFSRYISVILAQDNEEGGFKPDGTSWHHSGHYPAYGLGAFASVPKLIYLLSGTVFRIDREGHEHFKKALLTAAQYSQLYDWGFGNSGRHPLESSGGNNIRSLKSAFLAMVNSGNPEGTSKIDTEVAATYLRLWGEMDTINGKIFKNSGIEKALMPRYKTLPYAATSIHRYKDWAAIIKGYSKYVWSSEIYSDTNRYGRYPSNGSVELLNKEGEENSGIVQSGWDWNRYPGTTIVYLPLEQLETDKSLLMFLSEQTFAGAVQLEDLGVFGMVLDESGGSNADGLVEDRKISFPEKLRAKKSVFSFGDKLICIGSDISSIDKKHPVQTNLFQTFLKTPKMPMYVDELGLVDQFPFTVNAEKWIVDPYGNGYHVLSNDPIHIQRKEQHSYYNKYSVRTGALHSPPRGKGFKETKGDFATAWLDHGMAPKKGSYQYVIYPFMSVEDQKNFGQKIKKDTSYDVLRADSIAHIVLDKESSTMGYVVFEEKKQLEQGLLREVSAPAIIMLKKNNPKEITLSAVQPDLNFGSNKTRKNRFDNYSHPVNLSITLKGKWKVADKHKNMTVNRAMEGNTVISFQCQHGFSKKIKLIKV